MRAFTRRGSQLLRNIYIRSDHLIRNACAPARPRQSANQPIGQSRGSKSMHKRMWAWSRGFRCRSDQTSERDRNAVVGARRGGSRRKRLISRGGFSPTTESRVCREWCKKKKKKRKKASSEQQFCGRKRLVNERGQRRRARLVKADWKVTVMQITTHYNSGVQKSISYYSDYSLA